MIAGLILATHAIIAAGSAAYIHFVSEDFSTATSQMTFRLTLCALFYSLGLVGPAAIKNRKNAIDFHATFCFLGNIVFFASVYTLVTGGFTTVLTDLYEQIGFAVVSLFVLLQSLAGISLKNTEMTAKVYKDKAYLHGAFGPITYASLCAFVYFRLRESVILKTSPVFAELQIAHGPEIVVGLVLALPLVAIVALALKPTPKIAAKQD